MEKHFSRRRLSYKFSVMSSFLSLHWKCLLKQYLEDVKRDVKSFLDKIVKRKK